MLSSYQIKNHLNDRPVQKESIDILLIIILSQEFQLIAFESLIDLLQAIYYTKDFKNRILAYYGNSSDEIILDDNYFKSMMEYLIINIIHARLDDLLLKKINAQYIYKESIYNCLNNLKKTDGYDKFDIERDSLLHLFEEYLKENDSIQLLRIQFKIGEFQLSLLKKAKDCEDELCSSTFNFKKSLFLLTINLYSDIKDKLYVIDDFVIRAEQELYEKLNIYDNKKFLDFVEEFKKVNKLYGEEKTKKVNELNSPIKRKKKSSVISQNGINPLYFIPYNNKFKYIFEKKEPLIQSIHNIYPQITIEQALDEIWDKIYIINWKKSTLKRQFYNISQRKLPETNEIEKSLRNILSKPNPKNINKK